MLSEEAVVNDTPALVQSNNKSDVNTNKIISKRRSGEKAQACYPEEYEALLAIKTNELKSLLSNCINDKTIETFQSPKSNFRMRANFNIWRDKPGSDDPSGMYYMMYEKEGE